MRYFIGFLTIVALVVAVFIIVLRGFSGTSNKPKTQTNLIDYANTQTVVRYTVDGPVNADQIHQGYRITVGRDANTMEIIKGYQNNVIKAQTYDNNTEAYSNFLRALQLQNFTKGSADASKSDERGVCPNGNRYTFEIETAGQVTQRFWTTSCGGGTFLGNSQTIRTLFQRQIPDFSKLTASVNLSGF